MRSGKPRFAGPHGDGECPEQEVVSNYHFSRTSPNHRGIKCRHGKFRKLLQFTAWKRQRGKTREPQAVLAEQVTTEPPRKFQGIKRPCRKFHKLPQLRAWARQCKANRKRPLHTVEHSKNLELLESLLPAEQASSRDAELPQDFCWKSERSMVSPSMLRVQREKIEARRPRKVRKMQRNKTPEQALEGQVPAMAPESLSVKMQIDQEPVHSLLECSHHVSELPQAKQMSPTEQPIQQLDMMACAHPTAATEARGCSSQPVETAASKHLAQPLEVSDSGQPAQGTACQQSLEPAETHQSLEFTQASIGGQPIDSLTTMGIEQPAEPQSAPSPHCEAVASTASASPSVDVADQSDEQLARVSGLLTEEQPRQMVQNVAADELFQASVEEQLTGQQLAQPTCDSATNMPAQPSESSFCEAFIEPLKLAEAKERLVHVDAEQPEQFVQNSIEGAAESTCCVQPMEILACEHPTATQAADSSMCPLESADGEKTSHLIEALAGEQCTQCTTGDSSDQSGVHPVSGSEVLTEKLSTSNEFVEDMAVDELELGSAGDQPTGQQPAQPLHDSAANLSAQPSELAFSEEANGKLEHLDADEPSASIQFPHGTSASSAQPMDISVDEQITASQDAGSTVQPMDISHDDEPTHVAETSTGETSMETPTAFAPVQTQDISDPEQPNAAEDGHSPVHGMEISEQLVQPEQVLTDAQVAQLPEEALPPPVQPNELLSSGGSSELLGIGEQLAQPAPMQAVEQSSPLRIPCSEQEAEPVEPSHDEQTSHLEEAIDSRCEQPVQCSEVPIHEQFDAAGGSTNNSPELASETDAAETDAAAAAAAQITANWTTPPSDAAEVIATASGEEPKVWQDVCNTLDDEPAANTVAVPSEDADMSPTPAAETEAAAAAHLAEHVAAATSNCVEVIALAGAVADAGITPDKALPAEDAAANESVSTEASAANMPVTSTAFDAVRKTASATFAAVGHHLFSSSVDEKLVQVVEAPDDVSIEEKSTNEHGADAQKTEQADDFCGDAAPHAVVISKAQLGA
eukprot:TRINITY_DN87112_c0_g1_i1.p1 TRINITY_DN87112_c0_g1~~TRINITY_DN87112_c0_g1_i1.p1  ORF type:complete len:1034 (+),score=249.40 TRINITY_DN87112_c0_g1_i1:121-3222(+)